MLLGMGTLRRLAKENVYEAKDAARLLKMLNSGNAPLILHVSVRYTLVCKTLRVAYDMSQVTRFLTLSPFRNKKIVSNRNKPTTFPTWASLSPEICAPCLPPGRATFWQLKMKCSH